MAAGAKTNPAPSSSLQRLLSLDKSFDSFSERVEEAARIIGLSTDPEAESESLQHAAHSSLHTARHEFVLRWLSAKLNKESSVRKSPEAWSTLHRTFRHLPSPVISKAISTNDILSCIVKTFSDLFPTQNPLSAHASTVEEDGAAEKGSKKRKRAVPDKDHVSEKDQVLEADRRAIFLSIAALLRLLIDCSEHSDIAFNAPVNNQIRSLLRLDNAAFALLLSQWLAALLLFLPELDQPILSPQARVLSFGLHLIQDLLSLQSVSQHSDPAHSFDLLFSRHCTLPAALLLSRLHTISTSDAEQSSAIDGSVQVLERLLAQHVFVPARTAFHAGAEDSISVSNKSTRQNTPSLGERLDPFHRDLVSLLNTSQETFTTAQTALPYLLDIAFRCTPTSTPRQRIAEGPWMDSLFGALCGLLIKSTDPATLYIDSIAGQTLVDMLNIVIRRKLPLSKELLVELVRHWSMLETSSQSIRQPDFQVVAKVLAIDANLFTDVKEPRTQALFESLSSHGTQSHVGDSTRTLDIQSLLCHDIAVPLMKAFARIRGLRVFIDQWLLQLQKYPQWQKSQWSVWTDQSLQVSLRTVLESALTVTQITDLLESCRISLLGSSEASASAVVLNAVVGAVHSDSALDSMQESFHSLIETTQEIFSLLKPEESFFTTSLLTLLSHLYLLRFPALSTSHAIQEIEAISDAILGSPAMEISLGAIEGLSNTTKSRPAVADAAFTFVATISDLLRRFPNRNESIKVLLETARFAAHRPMAFYSTITQYPNLLEFMPQADRQAAFENLIPFASQEDTNNSAASEMFVDAVLSAATQAVRDDLFSTLISQQASEAEREAARSLLLRWSCRGLARQQRERILDIAVDTVLKSRGVSEELPAQLGLIVDLLDLPNATARIATDSSVIWQLASAIPAGGYGDHSLDLFEEVCNLLLKHIMDTKEQERSKAFITSLSKSLAAFTESKKALQSSPGKLRLLVAFLRATEVRLDATTLSDMPHRSSSAVDNLIKYLHQTLSTNLEEEEASEESRSSGLASAVQVYVSIPTQFQANGGSSSSKYAKRLTKLLGSLLAQSASSIRTDGLSIPLSVQIQCFEQLAPTMIREDAGQLCSITETLLCQDIDAKQHHAILHCLAESVHSVVDTQILSLIGQLLGVASGSLQITAQKVSLVHCLILSLGNENKDEISFLSVLDRILVLLGDCTVFETHCELVGCVVAILRNKPNMVTQHGVEATIATIVRLASPSSPSLDAKKGHVIFEGLCNITRSLFQFHRASLGGRYHVVIPMIQRLVSGLFTPASRDVGSASRFKHPAWIDNKQHPLTVSHAQRVSRLLENLCNPPQSDASRRRRKNESGHDLVDLERKIRIQVGQHVQHVLHYICTLILNGRLGEGMRDALTPGLWAVMDVVEIGADESRGVKALSASMNNAERAILRGMFEDWRRFGSWSG